MRLYPILIICCVIVAICSKVSVKSGKIYLTVNPGTVDQQKFKTDITSTVKSQIQLTQSSRISVLAEIEFTQHNFSPEFFSFRLKHPNYDNLTQPILVMQTSSQESTFKTTIDLGDSKVIKPFTGFYSLELIISDEKLSQNIKKDIARCRVTFRNSLSQVPKSELQYVLPNEIIVNPPQKRIDPPQTFTYFVCLLLGIQFIFFIWGLYYLKTNSKLLPSNPQGLFWNLLLIFALIANLTILLKFWLEWTFLFTIKNLLILSNNSLILALPTIIIANKAINTIRNRATGISDGSAISNKNNKKKQ